MIENKITLNLDIDNIINTQTMSYVDEIMRKFNKNYYDSIYNEYKLSTYQVFVQLDSSQINKVQLIAIFRMLNATMPMWYDIKITGRIIIKKCDENICISDTVISKRRYIRNLQIELESDYGITFDLHPYGTHGKISKNNLIEENPIKEEENPIKEEEISIKEEEIYIRNNLHTLFASLYRGIIKNDHYSCNIYKPGSKLYKRFSRTIFNRDIRDITVINNILKDASIIIEEIMHFDPEINYKFEKNELLYGHITEVSLDTDNIILSYVVNCENLSI